MAEGIWCEGKYWTVSEYNKRLSEENKIEEEYRKLISILEIEEEEKIKNIWK